MRLAPSTGLILFVGVFLLAGCESTSQWSPTVDSQHRKSIGFADLGAQDRSVSPVASEFSGLIMLEHAPMILHGQWGYRMRFSSVATQAHRSRTMGAASACPAPLAMRPANALVFIVTGMCRQWISKCSEPRQRPDVCDVDGDVGYLRAKA